MEVKYFQDSHTRVKRRENMICAHVIGTMHNFVSYLSKTTFPRYDAMTPGDPSFIMRGLGENLGAKRPCLA